MQLCSLTGVFVYMYEIDVHMYTVYVYYAVGH